MAVFACVLIVVLHKQLPEKTLTLVPSEQTYAGLFGPGFDAATQTGQGNLYWIDQGAQKWYCNNPPDYPYSCGYSLSFFPNLAKGIDLTGYRKLILNLKHTGDASHMRVALRNFNSKYDTGDRSLSSKFMSVLIQNEHLSKPITINLSEFTVAEWWMKEFDIPRELSKPEFNDVLSLSLDYLAPGVNTLEVNSVKVVGTWITSEQLYLSILAFWLIVIIWESISKFVELYQRYMRIQRHTEQLVEDYKQLEKDKEKYETLSTTDILTGALNRAGIHDFLQKLFDSDYEKSHLGLVLFDLDYFKRINDTRGHDVGDRVLVELSKIIRTATRASDLFGRWGGEEFILICPKSSLSDLKVLSEKLRSMVESHSFEPQRPLKVTVSIGATLARRDEPFEQAFKRLDNALYESKNKGRNCTTCI